MGCDLAMSKLVILDETGTRLVIIMVIRGEQRFKESAPGGERASAAYSPPYVLIMDRPDIFIFSLDLQDLRMG